MKTVHEVLKERVSGHFLITLFSPVLARAFIAFANLFPVDQFEIKRERVKNGDREEERIFITYTKMKEDAEGCDYLTAHYSVDELMGP